MGNTTIAVLEEVTQVVEIVLPGPQGPVGDIHPSMPGLVQQATDAATSATASALSADASEANASASATSALASKNAASESATVASTKAGEAATSATNAADSATTASTKASEASTSATDAAALAAAAATSATDTANALVGERSAVATLTNKTITSPVIDSGTANGVTYLDGNKVLTAGSGLTYNGSALQINAESYPSLKLGNAAGVSKGELYFGVGGDDLNLVSYVAGPIVFKPGNAEQMRLTSTGLGIGTSSPSAKIVTAQSNGGNTAYASVDSWADDFQTSRSGIGFNARIDRTAYSQVAVQLDSTNSGWLIQGRNAPGAEAVYDWFSVSRVSPTGVSTKMLNLDASGNLGLGVVPSAWQSAVKAIQVGPTGALFGYLTGAGFGSNFYSAEGTNRYIASDLIASSYEQDQGGHKWYTAPSGAAGQPISFTQAMTLDASGRLGIGTSSPDARLTVEGTVANLRNTSGTFTLNLTGLSIVEERLTTSGAGYGDWRLQTGNDSSGLSGSLRIYDVKAAAERLRIDASGNLGIGTSSPISRLHVTGDVRATGNLILVGGAGTPEVQFFQASRNWTIRNNAGSLEVYDSTASAVRATFNASGNLGLGVTPSAWGSLSALHVKGTAHFAGFSSGAEGAFVTSNAYFNGTSWIYQMTAAASHFRQSGGAHQWFTAPSGTAGQPISLTQAMTLSASGGLMVGTSTDYGERLHVSSAGAGDVISMRIAASQENGSNGMARRIQWSLRDSTGSLINTNSIRSEWSDVGANSAKLVFTSAANNAQADAMTLTASGHLLIGATSSDGVGSARAQIGNASAATTGLLLKSTTSSTSLYASSTSSSYLTWKTGTFMAFGASPDNLGTFAEYARIDSSGNLLVGKTAQSSGGKLEVAGNVVCRPSTAAPTLAVNGEMSFQLVSDTSLKILVRGSDGITRSTTLTLT